MPEPIPAKEEKKEEEEIKFSSQVAMEGMVKINPSLADKSNLYIKKYMEKFHGDIYSRVDWRTDSERTQERYDKKAIDPFGMAPALGIDPESMELKAHTFGKAVLTSVKDWGRSVVSGEFTTGLGMTLSEWITKLAVSPNATRPIDAITPNLRNLWVLANDNPEGKKLLEAHGIEEVSEEISKITDDFWQPMMERSKERGKFIARSLDTVPAVAVAWFGDIDKVLPTTNYLKKSQSEKDEEVIASQEPRKFADLFTNPVILGRITGSIATSAASMWAGGHLRSLGVVGTMWAMEAGDEYDSAMAIAIADGKTKKEAHRIAVSAAAVYAPVAAMLETIVPVSIMKTMRIGGWGNIKYLNSFAKKYSKNLSELEKQGVKGRALFDKTVRKTTKEFTTGVGKSIPFLTKFVEGGKFLVKETAMEGATEWTQYMSQAIINKGIVSGEPVTMDFLINEATSPGAMESFGAGLLGGKMFASFALAKNSLGKKGKNGLIAAEQLIKEREAILKVVNSFKGIQPTIKKRYGTLTNYADELTIALVNEIYTANDFNTRGYKNKKDGIGGSLLTAEEKIVFMQAVTKQKWTDTIKIKSEAKIKEAVPVTNAEIVLGSVKTGVPAKNEVKDIEDKKIAYDMAAAERVANKDVSDHNDTQQINYEIEEKSFLDIINNQDVFTAEDKIIEPAEEDNSVPSWSNIPSSQEAEIDEDNKVDTNNFGEETLVNPETGEAELSQEKIKNLVEDESYGGIVEDTNEQLFAKVEGNRKYESDPEIKISDISTLKKLGYSNDQIKSFGPSAVAQITEYKWRPAKFFNDTSPTPILTEEQEEAATTPENFLSELQEPIEDETSPVRVAYTKGGDASAVETSLSNREILINEDKLKKHWNDVIKGDRLLKFKKIDASSIEVGKPGSAIETYQDYKDFVIRHEKAKFENFDSVEGESPAVIEDALNQAILNDMVAEKAKFYKEAKKGSQKVKLKSGVEKIISGGQTGVDLTALKVAKYLGVPTGGTALPKFLQHTNLGKSTRAPWLAKEFGLTEGEADKKNTPISFYSNPYRIRTIKNAQEADGTIWLGPINNFPKDGLPGQPSFGYILTVSPKAQEGKPAPLVNPSNATEIRNWLLKNNIKTLNVAGHEAANLTIEERDRQANMLREALLGEDSSLAGAEVPTEPGRYWLFNEYAPPSSANKTLQIKSRWTEESDQEVDKIAIDFIKAMGFTIKQYRDMKRAIGIDALGFTDAISRIVGVAEGRKIDTLTEEAVHIAMLLSPSEIEDSKRAALRRVNDWEGYKRVWDEYKEVYTQEDGTPDKALIRQEALVKMISENVVYAVKTGEVEASYGDIRNWIDKFLTWVRKTFRNTWYNTLFKYSKAKYGPSLWAANQKLDVRNGNRFIEYLVADILANNYAKYKKGAEIPQGLQKVDYSDVLNKDPLAKDIIEKMQNAGFSLTGSLSLSRVGNIYRDGPIHDIDFKDPRIISGSDNFHKVQYLKQLKKIFPKVEFKNVFGRRDSRTFQYIVNGKNIDIFAGNHPVTARMFAKANVIFGAKLAYGRAKDTRDAYNYGPLHSELSQNIMYQLRKKAGISDYNTEANSLSYELEINPNFLKETEGIPEWSLETRTNIVWEWAQKHLGDEELANKLHKKHMEFAKKANELAKKGDVESEHHKELSHLSQMNREAYESIMITGSMANYTYTAGPNVSNSLRFDNPSESGTLEKAETISEGGSIEEGGTDEKGREEGYEDGAVLLPTKVKWNSVFETNFTNQDWATFFNLARESHRIASETKTMDTASNVFVKEVLKYIESTHPEATKVSAAFSYESQTGKTTVRNVVGMKADPVLYENFLKDFWVKVNSSIPLYVAGQDITDEGRRAPLYLASRTKPFTKKDGEVIWITDFSIAPQIGKYGDITTIDPETGKITNRVTGRALPAEYRMTFPELDRKIDTSEGKKNSVHIFEISKNDILNRNGKTGEEWYELRKEPFSKEDIKKLDAHPTIYFIGTKKGDNSSIILGRVPDFIKEMSIEEIKGELNKEFMALLEKYKDNEKMIEKINKNIKNLSQSFIFVNSLVGSSVDAYRKVYARHEAFKKILFNEYFLKEKNFRSTLNRLRIALSDGVIPWGLGSHSSLLLTIEDNPYILHNGKKIMMADNDGWMMSSKSFLRKIANVIGSNKTKFDDHELNMIKMSIRSRSENGEDYAGFKMMNMAPEEGMEVYIEGGIRLAVYKNDEWIGRDGVVFDHVATDNEAKQVSGKFEKYNQVHQHKETDIRIKIVPHNTSKKDGLSPSQHADIVYSNKHKESGDLINAYNNYYDSVSKHWIKKIVNTALSPAEFHKLFSKDNITDGRIKTEAQEWVDLDPSGNVLQIPSVKKYFIYEMTNKLIANGLFKARHGKKDWATQGYLKPSSMDIKDTEFMAASDNSMIKEKVFSYYKKETHKESASIQELNEFLKTHDLYFMVSKPPVEGPNSVGLRKLTRLVEGYHGDAFFVSKNDIQYTFQADFDGDKITLDLLDGEFGDNKLLKAMWKFQNSKGFDRRNKKLDLNVLFKKDEVETSSTNYEDMIDAITQQGKTEHATAILVNFKTIANALASKEFKMTYADPLSEMVYTIRAREPEEKVIMDYIELKTDKEAATLIEGNNDTTWSPKVRDTFKWAKEANNNYEVSTQGDKRFSALNARLSDGGTIEYHYQVKVKGYSTIEEGKGKPPKDTSIDSYAEYKKLWQQWAQENPNDIKDLREKARGKTLTDKFANTAVSQARALAEILSETEVGDSSIPKYLETTFEYEMKALLQMVVDDVKEGFLEQIKYNNKGFLYDRVFEVKTKDGTIVKYDSKEFPGAIRTLLTNMRREFNLSPIRHAYDKAEQSTIRIDDIYREAERLESKLPVTVEGKENQDYLYWLNQYVGGDYSSWTTVTANKFVSPVETIVRGLLHTKRQFERSIMGTKDNEERGRALVKEYNNIYEKNGRTNEIIRKVALDEIFRQINKNEFWNLPAFKNYEFTKNDYTIAEKFMDKLSVDYYRVHKATNRDKSKKNSSVNFLYNERFAKLTEKYLPEWQKLTKAQQAFSTLLFLSKPKSENVSNGKIIGQLNTNVSELLPVYLLDKNVMILYAEEFVRINNWSYKDILERDVSKRFRSELKKSSLGNIITKC